MNRIREEVYKIIEAYTNETAPTNEQLVNFKATLEGNCITVLKKGLKPEIEQCISDGGIFSEAIQKAIKAEIYLKNWVQTTKSV